LLERRAHADSHVQKILALFEIHGEARVLRAIADALAFQAFSSEYIAHLVTRVRQKYRQVIVCAQFTGSKLALQASGGGLGRGDGFEQLLVLGG
jgi:thymidylate kinase